MMLAPPRALLSLANFSLERWHDHPSSCHYEQGLLGPQGARDCSRLESKSVGFPASIPREPADSDFPGFKHPVMATALEVTRLEKSADTLRYLKKSKLF